MPKLPPPPNEDKLIAIVAAAARAFALAGYHRTQMADIAAHAGVALGTLYRYAPSKEDLFAYALAYGAGRSPLDVSPLTPIRDVEAYFERHALTWFDLEAFSRELRGAEQTAPLPQALATLYAEIESRRLTVRIIDRSAHDLPRLGKTYSRGVREPILRLLTQHLEALQTSGAISPLSDTRASARFALEVCAWFAMHRLFSPGGMEISDKTARQTALSHLSMAFGVAP